jgi:hypothetical protein
MPQKIGGEADKAYKGRFGLRQEFGGFGKKSAVDRFSGAKAFAEFRRSTGRCASD